MDLSHVSIVESITSEIDELLELPIIWKTEGPTDLFALCSCLLELSKIHPHRHRCWTNSHGATESPIGLDSNYQEKTWCFEPLRGKIAYIVHDCDKPGQAGALEVVNGNGRSRPGWAPVIARYAAECRNIVLPSEISESKGEDLEDFLEGMLLKYLELGYELEKARAHSYLSLLQYAQDQPVIRMSAKALKQAEDDEKNRPEKQHADTKPSVVYAENDPVFLAQVISDRYMCEQKRRLVFWRQDWWRYKEGVYRRWSNDEAEAAIHKAIAEEFAQQFLDSDDEDLEHPRMVTSSVMLNVMKAMKAKCILSSETEMPCWLDGRNGKNWLSMGNGLIDLEAVAAGKDIDDCLLPHDHNWFSPLKLEYDFEVTCRCDTWHKVVSEAMEGDQERIDLLQEWFGYLLIPGHEQQKFVCFEGRGGDGKSTIFTVIRAMLGENNVSYLSLSDFSRNFGLDSTIGKALNIADDCSSDTVLDLGKFKQFVGGAPLSMDRKNKERLNTVPTAKIMCAWNTRLKIKDETDSFWRRLILFPFKKLKSKPNKKMIDVRFWLESGEMPGVLLWAIKGLVRLQNQGEFTFSQVCENAKNDYREQRNPTQRFLKDHLIADPNGRIKVKWLYTLYQHWCEEESITPLGTEMFGTHLKQVFTEVEKSRPNIRGMRHYEYVGIDFSSTEIEGRSVFESGF